MKKLGLRYRLVFLCIFLVIITIFCAYHFILKPQKVEGTGPEGQSIIELKLEVYKEKIEPDEYTKKFNKPIIVFVNHEEARFVLYPSFVITDFKKGEITYLTMSTSENVEKFEEHQASKQISSKYGRCRPHTFLTTITPEESFYVLTHDCGLFYYINIKKKIIKIITLEALGIKDEDKMPIIGATFSKKHDDPNALYIITTSQTDEGRKLTYYLSSLDLRKIKKIYESPPERYFGSIHQLLDYKGYLLTSNFLHTKFKLTNKNVEFNTLGEFYNFVIADNESAEMYFNQSYENRSFNDFKRFCSENEEYHFEIQPGVINLFDPLSKKDLEMYYTSLSNPAHFELDEEEDNIIYVSVHNFDSFKGVTSFLGNAGIDKFKLENGKLVYIDTFVNSRGYRFPTHRVFRYKDKPYIVTIGYPNRLFIIDAETMELFYYQDIGKDFLSGEQGSNELYAVTAEKDQVKIPSMEVSDDGSVIFFVSNENVIYLYSFPDRKIVKKIEYKPPILGLDEGIKPKTPFDGHTHYL